MPRKPDADDRQETGTAPVSYFRIYNPKMLINFKVRAVQLERYLQECWEEATLDWLAKAKPISPGAGRQDKDAPRLVGIRMDPALAHKLKERAATLSRSHGDCLEEAGIDWLKKHNASKKGKIPYLLQPTIPS